VPAIKVEPAVAQTAARTVVPTITPSAERVVAHVSTPGVVNYYNRTTPNIGVDSSGRS
jgi:hypothetical protein